MTPHARFLFLLLAFAAAPSAAMEKCVSPEGKVSYSQQPCPTGARRAAIGAGSASAGAAGQARVRYYDVHGADQAALLASLNARGDFHGLATWTVRYSYDTQRVANGCGVAAATVTLDLVMELPRWTPPPGAAPELVARWERYVTSLRTHEEGHLDHGREMAKELKARLAPLTARTCEVLEKVARAHFDDLLGQYQERDREYDARTASGRTQGAFFK